jgi:hypothetical protein
MLIDYAYPCMQAEKALKDTHNAMLRNDHQEALQRASDCIGHVEAMLFAITHMMEEAHARKAQVGV